MAEKPIAASVDVVAHLTERHEAGEMFSEHHLEGHETTQPHDGVESTFVTFAVGPSTSILDRARDLLRSRPA